MHLCMIKSTSRCKNVRLLLQIRIRNLPIRVRFCERGALNSARSPQKGQSPPEGYAESVFRNDKTHPLTSDNLMCRLGLLHHKFRRQPDLFRRDEPNTELRQDIHSVELFKPLDRRSIAETLSQHAVEMTGRKNGCFRSNMLH